MNSDNYPEEELPSVARLWAATGIALGVALIILVLFILPAEYGIDVTGVGRLTGLKTMGEVKQSLSEELGAELAAGEPCEDEAEYPGDVNEAGTSPGGTGEGKSNPVNGAASKNTGLKTDTVRVTLKPGAASEYKLVMDVGARVHYIWTVDKGHLNFDIHADSDTLKYYGYGKGMRQTSDEGDLVAAFTGKHGWFWRNRSKVTVTLTLVVRGAYRQIKKIV